jgi:hypothetical protein
MMRDACWSTDDRKEQVVGLLHSTLGSMPHPDNAAAAAEVAEAEASAQASSAASHFPPPPPPPPAAAAGLQQAAEVQLTGQGSKWVAAQECLRSALQDLLQQQQQGGQDSAQHGEMQDTMRVVTRMAVRSHMDVHARYLLAHMEVSCWVTQLFGN